MKRKLHSYSFPQSLVNKFHQKYHKSTNQTYTILHPEWAQCDKFAYKWENILDKVKLTFKNHYCNPKNSFIYIPSKPSTHYEQAIRHMKTKRKQLTVPFSGDQVAYFSQKSSRATNRQEARLDPNKPRNVDRYIQLYEIQFWIGKWKDLEKI